MNYRLSEIAPAVSGYLAGSDLTVTGILTDSRAGQVGAGDLFAALVGPNHNGHNYIGDMYARGVRAFMVSDGNISALYADASFVVVKDTLRALQYLAAYRRRSMQGTVVAVTGSNGKTIVKEWIGQLLGPDERVFRSPKSYNSQLGVALSLLMAPDDLDLYIFEAGISQPGEMERLGSMIMPRIGVMTNIGDAHQENFTDLVHKASEKLTLFASAETIVYDGRDPVIGPLIRKRFGDRNLMDYSGFTALTGYADRWSQDNAAAAVAVSVTLGGDVRQLQERVAALEPVSMRLETREGNGGAVVVHDYYNSDINSLSIALSHLGSVAAGREKILILSDILQSGLRGEELYSKAADMAHTSGVKQIIGIGEAISRYNYLFPAGSVFYPNVEVFLSSYRLGSLDGKAVLLKGNNSARFEKVGRALDRQSHVTVLEVDLDAMVHNLNVHRRLLPPATKVMAMIKASAYGNGAVETAALLQRHEVDYLAVAFADEGVLLREQGINLPIVVLNADDSSFDKMIVHGLEPEIYNFRSLAGFISATRAAGVTDYPVHIKVDTGMHRLGFSPSEMERLADIMLRRSCPVRVASVFSHLAAADEPGHDPFTQQQCAIFTAASAALSARLGYVPLRHLANSAGMERFPGAVFDMVRLGIGLYGIGTDEKIELRPVSSLRTRVVQVKEIKAGETVGYGRSGVARHDMRVAALPLGYADGVDRRLGEGRWRMIAAGHEVPTFGRICMDLTMIDVTGTEVAEGDEVTVFGPQRGNTVEDMARALGTIPYEVMTSVAPRVKRIYIRE